MRGFLGASLVWRPGHGRVGRAVVLLVVTALALVDGAAGPLATHDAGAADRDTAALRRAADALAASTGTQSRTPSPVPESTPAPPGRSTPAPAARAVHRPVAGSAVVTLGGDAAPVAGDVLTVAAGTGRAAGVPVRVEMLDSAAADRAGVSGFLFTISPAGQSGGDAGVSPAGLAEGQPVSDGSAAAGGPTARVTVNYAPFVEAYGAGYADRLQVVALPPCVATVPRPADCDSTPVAVPSRVDAAASRLIADAIPLTGSTALYAVTAGPSGQTGNFGATPLNSASRWQVAPGSGEFSWSYDIPVPQPPYGTAPTVGLSYSSGAVDGLVSTGNSQSGMSGLGWSDFAGSFVERRYTGCTTTADLCWLSHNATISLNGRASELIAMDPNRTEWRLKNDPGWKVEAIQAGTDNGDNDREAWRVTTPDGTRYFFGLGRNPDTGASTESVWTVPVVADHAGEPCRGADNTLGACDQAWRWNLDRVISPNGIVTTYSYVKELNHYRALGGFGNRQHPYTRAGRLSLIEYGKPQGTGTDVAPAGRVVFEAEQRCRALKDCPDATPANGNLFPDVPADLMCSSDCLVMTPTFFTTKRYSAVRTEVRAGGGWRPVHRVDLHHGWGANSDGALKLGLNGIQKVGQHDGEMRLPAVNFLYTELPNRVDVDASAGRTAMGHHRLTFIRDELGARTAVVYVQPNQCARTYTGPWHTNGRDCFPRKLGSTSGVFHKYLAGRVEQQDPLGGSPTMVTTYTYEGSPAWHHDDDEYTPLADQSWSDWRGYGTTTITSGASRKKVRVYRGMQGDRLAGGGVRASTVEPFDGAGFDTVAPTVDVPWLAGATLVEARLGGFNEVTDASLHEYDVRPTARPGNDEQDWAAWVAERSTTASIAMTLNTFARQRSSTTYNVSLLPEAVYEEGWLDRTGDERCTHTTYAANATAGLLDRPSTVTVYGGQCGSTAPLTQREIYYDGSATLGAVTKGNPTRQRLRVDANRWVDTAIIAYDPYGRPARVTDAAGQVVTTAHELTPNGGYPLVTSVTRQAGTVTHTTSTHWVPELGLPDETVDANGNVTTYGYDPLGRLWRVRQPTEQPLTDGKPPSWEFSYHISGDYSAPPVVHTKRVQSADLTKFLESWRVLDSFGRPRQEHVRSPETGKVIVTGTSYNAQGLVEDRTAPQAVAGTPGSGRLAVAWQNKTRTTYDTIGRVSRQSYFLNATEQWAVSTTYTHDTTTTVTQPDGRSTRSVVDGLGRTVRVEQRDGTTWNGTTQTHDGAGRLLTITDPAGNRITNSYNMAGWRTAMDDPDSGTWTYTYDNTGNLVTSTDAAGAVTHQTYDGFGRVTERRAGGPTGPVQARWAYDAPGEKGLLDKSTRITPQGSWVVDVTGYDGRGRPLGTQWTVPASALGLTGTYTVGYGYDRADAVTSMSYPAVGGLPAETVTTTYNAQGQPDSLAGIDRYVWAASYDNRGRPGLFGVGPRPREAGTWMAKAYSYDDNQRLARTQTLVTGSSVDHRYTYEPTGNLLSRTTQLGDQNWRECYGYDAMARLTSAYTTTTGACDGTARGTGSQPYDHAYAYSGNGNLLSRTENGATIGYTYPAAGADRPHAPTSVGADTYRWNANGGLTGRTVGGRAETLTWDADRRLATVDGPEGTTGFLYDAGGSRILRTTPQGRTFYFAGHEVTASADGMAVTAARSYDFNGEPLAVRTPGRVDYLVVDQQGSVEASLPAGGALNVGRAYDPYGKRRSGGELATDQGWIGQIEDDSTDLSYLNARYYDPNLGRFLSPDPIYSPSRPQTLNAYNYGLNNPTNFTDASGLMACGGKSWECGKESKTNPSCAKHKCGKQTGSTTLYRPPPSGAGGGGGSSWSPSPYSPPTGGGGGGGGNSYDAAQAAREHQDRITLMGMAKANGNPEFWIALAAAGSGSALVLHGLHAGNPNPDFWFALHKAGSGSALLKIAESIRLNREAQPFRSMGKTLSDDEGWLDELEEADSCPLTRYPNREGCVGGGIPAKATILGILGAIGGCIWGAINWGGPGVQTRSRRSRCAEAGTKGGWGGFFGGHLLPDDSGGNDRDEELDEMRRRLDELEANQNNRSTSSSVCENLFNINC